VCDYDEEADDIMPDLPEVAHKSPNYLENDPQIALMISRRGRGARKYNVEPPQHHHNTTITPP
jgi:hypothetical protein